MLTIIPNWQNKHLKCHCCGTTKRVKYEVSMNGAVVSACNKCVIKFADHPTEKGGAE